jgi:MFS family permease
MALAMGVSAGSIANYSFGLLLKGVVEELHWTRGAASAAISLYMLGLAISVPLFGAVIDRRGARGPTLASITMFAVMLAVTAQAPSAMLFTVLLATTGLIAGGTTTIPYVVTIASRFSRRRGLALGIGAAGVGLGGVLLPPIVETLNRNHGWRAGFLGLALLIPLVALPGAIATLTPRPYAPRLTEGTRITERVAAWRVKAFWLIAASVLLICIAIGGVMIHAVSILTDHGASHQLAASIISFVAAGTICGRIGGGFFMDRWHGPYVAAGFFIFAALSLMLLLLGKSAVAIAGLIGVGVTVGSEADVIAFLSARYLRLPGLGRANGFLMLILSVGNATGVALLGYLFDVFRSYTIGLAIGVIFALLAAVVIVRLGPYPQMVVESGDS